jgi:hypothetical protein
MIKTIAANFGKLSQQRGFHCMKDFDTYASEAHTRASRRKSLWNLLLPALAFPSAGWLTWTLADLIVHLFLPSSLPMSDIVRKDGNALTVVIL